MPLIKIEVPELPPEHQKHKILTDASAIVSKNTGKTEQYIMVTLSQADFAMAGSPVPAAFVDVRGIGGINAESNRGISKDICAMLKAELDISPANIYLNFTDVPAQNWGHNGVLSADMSSSFEQAYETGKDRFISEWSELLRFPSISAQPEHEADCLACAQWLVAHLQKLNFTARLQETAGKPLVIAGREGKPGHPTVLIYGHYDVQPEDPLEDWASPPFEPEIRDGRLYARGAEDNKGQLFYVVKALELLLEQDKLNCGIKIVFEGEEESEGSTALTAYVKDNADEFKADILVVTDVNRVASGAPTIIMGLRGIVAIEVKLTGASYDLHSGLHGGTAPNPATAMARLIASFHNEDGSIAVDGYERNIRPISDKERRLAETAPFNAALYEEQTGVPPVAGERGLPEFERVGFRPTIEVNGLHSGYGGPGGKTIIPSQAIAKISSRIVADQTPAEALAALRDHIMKHAPAGLKMEMHGADHGGPPLRVDPDMESIRKAQEVLEEITGQKPVFYYEGASIPVIPALSEASGADPVLVGFGTEDGRAHAPNESFALEDFKLGCLYACELLSSL